MIERSIDYLHASLMLSESVLIMKGFKALPPIKFYKRGYLHPFGFRLYFGNPNSPKAALVASGETLQSLRNDQHSDAEIVDWVLSRGGEISRLDLAVTEWIEDQLVTIGDVKTWVKNDLVESSLIGGGAREIISFTQVSEDTHETLYIGDIKKRGKRGIFRAYDKGVELGIGSEIVTRLELELKREKAHNVAKRVASTNDIAGNFRTHFNVKSNDFERLMQAPAIPAVRGKNLVKQAESEEQARRWDWLLKQVAPALKQAIEDDKIEVYGNPRVTDFLIRAGLAPKLQWKRKKVVSSLELD